MRLGAKELREIDEKELQEKLKTIQRKPIYFILEDIYDTYNVGGLFRLADALAVEKMYLCGEMETPPNHRIKKASIGTYKVVPWEYKKKVKEAIEEVRSTSEFFEFDGSPPHKGESQLTKNLTASRATQIIAVEQNPKAVPYTGTVYSFPLALVFGNETSGIKEETLKLCDQIVEISMWGINKSLNVIVSAAIVGYWSITKLKRQ